MKMCSGICEKIERNKAPKKTLEKYVLNIQSTMFIKIYFSWELELEQ